MKGTGGLRTKPTHATCTGFADALNDALLEMVDDKLIDRDHYET